MPSTLIKTYQNMSHKTCITQRYIAISILMEHSITIQYSITLSIYNRNSPKTFIISTKILLPAGVIYTFLTSEGGKPLYCSKKLPKISGPTVSVTNRFHRIAVSICIADPLQQL